MTRAASWKAGVTRVSRDQPVGDECRGDGTEGLESGQRCEEVSSVLNVSSNQVERNQRTLGRASIVMVASIGMLPLSHQLTSATWSIAFHVPNTETTMESVFMSSNGGVDLHHRSEETQ